MSMKSSPKEPFYGYGHGHGHGLGLGHGHDLSSDHIVAPNTMHQRPGFQGSHFFGSAVGTTDSMTCLSQGLVRDPYYKISADKI